MKRIRAEVFFSISCRRLSSLPSSFALFNGGKDFWSRKSLAGAAILKPRLWAALSAAPNTMESTSAGSKRYSVSSMVEVPDRRIISGAPIWHTIVRELRYERTPQPFRDTSGTPHSRARDLFVCTREAPSALDPDRE